MTWLRETFLRPGFWLGRPVRSNATPTVTVVIPAHNEESLVRATVQSVRAQDYPCTIVVVDDASDDLTSWEATRGRPDIVVRTPRRMGSKSAAINYALGHVHTEVLVCVDADTILEPDAIRHLVATMAPDVAVASGGVRTRYRSNVWERGRYAEYLMAQVIVKAAQHNGGFMMVASGCLFGVRMEFLRRQGGFPAGTIAEDMDLTWRAIEDGWRVTYAPDAICHVVDPSDWRTYRGQLLRWYRGFIQCLHSRRWRPGRARLAVPAYAYLGLAMITPLALGAGLYALIAGGGLLGALMGFAGGLGIGLAVCYWRARAEGVSLREFAGCALCMLALVPVNNMLLWEAVVREGVMGQRLVKWEKGH